MAESKKATSSSIKPKEKESLLDVDIGKEFLSSWKSISMNEDDGMDLNFGTVSKGKTKAFNFDNMDMDFCLDGDFDKISTFKVNVPDLDFSSPPKKSTKSKERPEEECSVGNDRGKKDGFDFMFDFNDLDSFNIDSCLIKEAKTNKKQESRKENSSDRVQEQDPKSHLAEGFGALDDTATMKLSAYESLEVSKHGTSLGSPEHISSRKDDPSRSVTSGRHILSHSAGFSPDKTIKDNTEVIDEWGHSPDDAMSIKPYAQKTTGDLYDESLVGINSNRNTFSEKSIETFSMGTRNKASREKEDTIDEIEVDAGSVHNIIPSKNSSPPHITEDASQSTRSVLDAEENSSEFVKEQAPHAIKDLTSNQISISKLPSSHLGSQFTFDKVTMRSENEDGSFHTKFSERLHETKPLLNQSASFETACLSSELKPHVYQTIPPASEEGEEGINANDAETGSKINCDPVSIAEDIKNSEDVLHGNEKHVNNLCNISAEPVIDKMKLKNEKEAGVFYSKYSKSSEEIASPLRQLAPLETKLPSAGLKRIGSIDTSTTSAKGKSTTSNDVLTGSNLHAKSGPVARELTKSVDHRFMESEKKGTNSVNFREGINSNGLPKDCNANGSSRRHEKEGTRREPVMVGSEKSVKDHNNLSLLVSSSIASQKMIKSSSQTSANPKLVSSMTPMQNSKMSVEGSKLYPNKAGMKTPDLFIRSSKNLGGKPVSLSYTPKKENNSCLYSVKNVELGSLAALETIHPVSSNEKRLPLNLSLKRKALVSSTSELALATLKPLKRLSKSPSSDAKKSSGRILEEKVEDKITSTTKDYPSSTFASPQEIKMMEIEISTVMQNDGIFEKAEAYKKELESICNTLRKKHEEAKELLVRAVVNNNYLLMLNHPMYEEKICKVQDFAAELMSKCSLTHDEFSRRDLVLFCSVHSESKQFSSQHGSNLDVMLCKLWSSLNVTSYLHIAPFFWKY